jgi:hypothetical protein
MLVLLMGNGAHEWLHACASHEDTLHHIVIDEDHSNEKQIEEHHTHCKYLEWQLPAFCISTPITFVNNTIVVYKDSYVQKNVVLITTPRLHSADRGPPTTV